VRFGSGSGPGSGATIGCIFSRGLLVDLDRIGGVVSGGGLDTSVEACSGSNCGSGLGGRTGHIFGQGLLVDLGCALATNACFLLAYIHTHHKLCDAGMFI
jgi:hypothetical protein